MDYLLLIGDTIAIVTVIGIVIALVLRSVLLWYWKIDKIEKHLFDISYYLSAIANSEKKLDKTEK